MTTSSSQLQRLAEFRLWKEYRDILNDSDSLREAGIIKCHVREEFPLNTLSESRSSRFGSTEPQIQKAPFEWHVVIQPKSGNYVGLTLHLILYFRTSYPKTPPRVHISTRIPHSNVHSEDYICLDLLEEKSFSGRRDEGWTPAYSVRALLMQLQAFFFDTWSLQDFGNYLHTLWEHWDGSKRTPERARYRFGETYTQIASFQCKCCGFNIGANYGTLSRSSRKEHASNGTNINDTRISSMSTRTPGLFYRGDLWIYLDENATLLEERVLIAEVVKVERHDNTFATYGMSVHLRPLSFSVLFAKFSTVFLSHAMHTVARDNKNDLNNDTVGSPGANEEEGQVSGRGNTGSACTASWNEESFRTAINELCALPYGDFSKVYFLRPSDIVDDDGKGMSISELCSIFTAYCIRENKRSMMTNYTAVDVNIGGEDESKTDMDTSITSLLPGFDSNTPSFAVPPVFHTDEPPPPWIRANYLCEESRPVLRCNNTASSSSDSSDVAVRYIPGSRSTRQGVRESTSSCRVHEKNPLLSSSSKGVDDTNRYVPDFDEIDSLHEQATLSTKINELPHEIFANNICAFLSESDIRNLAQTKSNAAVQALAEQKIRQDYQIPQEMRCFYSQQAPEDITIVPKKYESDGAEFSQDEKTMLGVGVQRVSTGFLDKIDLVCNYDLLSYEAFHEFGVRRGVWGDTIHDWFPVAVDREHFNRTLPFLMEILADWNRNDKSLAERLNSTSKKFRVPGLEYPYFASYGSDVPDVLLATADSYSSWMDRQTPFPTPMKPVQDRKTSRTKEEHQGDENQEDIIFCTPVQVDSSQKIIPEFEKNEARCSSCAAPADQRNSRDIVYVKTSGGFPVALFSDMVHLWSESITPICLDAADLFSESNITPTGLDVAATDVATSICEDDSVNSTTSSSSVNADTSNYSTSIGKGSRAVPLNHVLTADVDEQYTKKYNTSTARTTRCDECPDEREANTKIIQTSSKDIHIDTNNYCSSGVVSHSRSREDVDTNDVVKTSSTTNDSKINRPVLYDKFEIIFAENLSLPEKLKKLALLDERDEENEEKDDDDNIITILSNADDINNPNGTDDYNISTKDDEKPETSTTVISRNYITNIKAVASNTEERVNRFSTSNSSILKISTATTRKAFSCSAEEETSSPTLLTNEKTGGVSSQPTILSARPSSWQKAPPNKNAIHNINEAKLQTQEARTVVDLNSETDFPSLAQANPLDSSVRARENARKDRSRMMHVGSALGNLLTRQYKDGTEDPGSLFTFPDHLEGHHRRVNYDQNHDECVLPQKFVRDIIAIIPRLMNSQLVKIMKGEVHGSEKALAGYMGFHHMLLLCCERFPILKAQITAIVDNFVHYEYFRTKEQVPNIGEFLCLLSVVDTYEWKDLSSALVEETAARGIRWVKEKDRVVECRDSAEILECVFKSTVVGRRLLMFHKWFLENVARPVHQHRNSSSSSSRAEPPQTQNNESCLCTSSTCLLKRYEKTKGLPSSRQIQELQGAVKHLCNEINSWESYGEALDLEFLDGAYEEDLVCFFFWHADNLGRSRDYH